MIISKRKNLSNWLEQNYWFEDGFISGVINNSLELKITIARQTDGTYIAGEPRTLVEYMIKPQGVLKWTFSDEDFSPGLDYCIDSIELPEKGFGLIFRTPNIFELLCESIEICNPKIINTITKAWTSNDLIFVEAIGIESIKPEYWIASLKEKDIIAGFRYFGGDLIEAEDVPYPDYSGYYIQLIDKINETQKGIFFESISINKKTLNLAIKLEDNNLIKVWNEILRIISSWSNITIHSGNVNFIVHEWRDYLQSNRLPRNLDRINKTCGNTG